MAKKPVFTEEQADLLSELGIEDDEDDGGLAGHGALEERVIGGFEEITRFCETHGRPPLNTEDGDIFERLYAVRLGSILGSAECLKILANAPDPFGLLAEAAPPPSGETDIDALLAELGCDEDEEDEDDVSVLKHVKPRSTAETPAKRIPCADFATFAPLFQRVQAELNDGTRVSRRFKKDAAIRKGEFFILGGQIAYAAEEGEPFKTPGGQTNARLRVIYDNGTESDMLMLSLQRALYKDETGRRVSDPLAGPLFSDKTEDGDAESGMIYVLRSLSEDPFVKAHREVIHKIGVTGGNVETRLAGTAPDPTYLLAEVEVVATYRLANIQRAKLEKLIHQFFEPARLDITLHDRFGHPVKPREWFLTPLSVINEAIEKITDGTITRFIYDKDLQALRPIT